MRGAGPWAHQSLRAQRTTSAASPAETLRDQASQAFASLKKGTRAQLKFQGIQRPPFLYPTLLEAVRKFLEPTT